MLCAPDPLKLTVFGIDVASRWPKVITDDVVPPMFNTEFAALVQVEARLLPLILLVIFTVPLFVIVFPLPINIAGAIVILDDAGIDLSTPSVIVPLPVMLPVPLNVVPAATELVTLEEPNASVPSTFIFPLTVSNAPPLMVKVVPLPMFISPVRVIAEFDDDEPVPTVVRLAITHDEVAENRPVPVVFKFVVVKTWQRHW